MKFPTIHTLLLEVTMQQVEQRFKSKKFLKAFARHPVKDAPTPAKAKAMIHALVPADIEEKYKPEALNWLITSFVSSQNPDGWGPEGIKPGRFFTVAQYAYVTQSLEDFYQLKETAPRLLQEPDIYQYDSFEEFKNTMDSARDAAAANLQFDPEQAEKGSELVGETPEWKIYIPRNKDAACQLGQNTKWCTSASERYYNEYHSDEDPLIIFKHKHDEKQDAQLFFDVKNAGENSQYMDVKDRPLQRHRLDPLIKILKRFKHELPARLTSLLTRMR